MFRASGKKAYGCLLLFWQHHRFAIRGGVFPSPLDGFWRGDSVMEHLGVGAPDALGKVKIPPVLEGCAAGQYECEQEKDSASDGGSGMVLVHGFSE